MLVRLVIGGLAGYLAAGYVKKADGTPYVSPTTGAAIGGAAAWLLLR